MSLYSIMGVAQAAMAAQTAGLDVAGQNVANAGVAGYVRRTAILETSAVTSGGVSFVGIARDLDRFLQSRYTDQSGKEAAAQARSDALGGFEQVIAPGEGNGIDAKASAFFSSFNALSQNASDPSARAAALGAAQDLAQSISSAASQLGQQKGELANKASSTVEDLNQRIDKVAALNAQIVSATGAGQDANGLKDQRDQLVNEIGQRINVSAVPDKSGAVTLLTNGAALVSGNRPSHVSVGLDGAGALQFKVQGTGGSSTDITKGVTQGTLGGLKEARDSDLPKTQAALDQFAYDVSNAVNTVHAAGVGMDGVGGRNLFTAPTQVAGAAYQMAVDPAVAGDPNKLAAASSAADLPGGGDTALAMATLASRALGTSTSPAAAFASIASGVGVAKQSADSELSLRQSTTAQANTALQSQSGVSVDEEMIDMSRYQRAYEASMKVLKTADDLLGGLMQEFS